MRLLIVSAVCGMLLAVAPLLADGEEGKQKQPQKQPAQQQPVKQPVLINKARGRYAIVLASDFEDQDFDGVQTKWGKVLELLKKKYQKTGCKVFRYKGMPNKDAALKKALAEYRPTYVCFLRRPKRCSVKFCVSVVKLMRSLDDDPYPDAIWAIFTAYNDKDALKMVEAKPLLVRRHLSHVGSGWLKWFESGVSFSEGRRGEKWIKKPGKEPERVEGPNDTAEQWVKVLNKNDVDILSTSGHATERDWGMGYPHWGGKVKVVGGGKLAAFENLGRGKRHDIKTDNPKIYYSPGNCLIAHIPCERRFIRDCMVLSWMHNGVYQFFGHVLPQTRWCTAWGVAEKFFALQDTYTFAEAVYANRIAGRYLTNNRKGGREKYFWNRCLHITVLYGDPAWEARMKRVKKPLYEFKLNVTSAKEGRKKATLTLKFNYKCKIGDRNLPVFLLPFFISDWKVEKIDKGKAVIADNFVLFDLLGKEFNKGDKVELVFSFKKVADLK
ncbi:MAG: hypothetical protein DRP63_02720 [Planctomycetota bacterium]|nr:MAG: hypothetical protein DRP63_02720 [Planctomycetota bacterium]